MIDRQNLPELDVVKRDPAKAFSEPQDVLAQEHLSYEDKLEILQKWELDERALVRATGENMNGGEDSKLHEVLVALERLRARAEGNSD